MAYLEIRRHSKRERPSKHLSQEGVLLARHVGRRMGPFERVVSSSAWRCVETAVAMGFAVDEVRDDLHMDRADDQVPAEALGLGRFEEFAEAVADGGRVKKFAEDLRDTWAEIARALDRGGRGLVVGHGAMIELGAVAALPQADYARWGKGLGVCEGVGLEFERGKFVAGEILRTRPRGKGAPV
jgi:broad specificity phosphatase PhoE